MPDVGDSRPIRILSSVDLPAPFGPRRPMRPGLRRKLTSRRASTAPNVRPIPSSSIRESINGCFAVRGLSFKGCAVTGVHPVSRSPGGATERSQGWSAAKPLEQSATSIAGSPEGRKSLAPFQGL